VARNVAPLGTDADPRRLAMTAPSSGESDDILYLATAAVRTALSRIDPLEVMAATLSLHARGATVLPEESYLGWTTPDGADARSLSLPGLVRDTMTPIGVKIINSSLGNELRRLPRASGFVLLFDPATARVTTIMAAADISALRTAAVTALAVDLLATKPLRRMAVLGAGTLAHAHLELLLPRLPDLASLRIYDVIGEKAEELRLKAAGMAADVAITVAASPEPAIADAQLVVAVTTARSGYIERSWLAPGALLVNVSLDDPLPEVILEAEMLVVDDWNLVRADERRLLGRLARAGLVVGPREEPVDGRRRVDAELGDIVAGVEPGRARADDVIVVNPFGLGIEDVALAHRVRRVALEDGLGFWLER
jgi:N-[(2S)-2-amino-2-carboxyethyl]-L-glutamate dehydrogenase